PEVVLQAVDRDEFFDSNAMIFQAPLEGCHLDDVLAKPLALNVALHAHRFHIIVFVDPADDRRCGCHRPDDGCQDHRQNANGDHHASSVEEDVPHVATDVAWNDLDLDHAGSTSLAQG